MLQTDHVHQLPPPQASSRRLTRPQHTGEPSTPATRFRRSRLGPFVVTIVLCLMGVALYMWPRVQVVRLAYRMQGAEQRVKALRQEHDDLRGELASLNDPQRLYRIATEQLGLSLPTHDRVFVLTWQAGGR